MRRTGRYRGSSRQTFLLGSFVGFFRPSLDLHPTSSAIRSHGEVRNTKDEPREAVDSSRIRIDEVESLRIPRASARSCL